MTENQINNPQIAQVRRVTWIGLAANVLLSGFKLVAGTIGSSQAIVADGVHSLSDMTTDIVLLIGVRYWSAPPDQDHPHGHHRIETMITVFIGIVLAFAGLGLGYRALVTLQVKPAVPPGLIALIAALVSFASKEILYRYSVGVGKRIKSSAVIANAWHHRSDSLSSIPPAIAVAGAMFFPEWYFLDRIGAVMVSLFILQAAWKIALPAVKELTDWGAEPEVYERIKEISLSTDGVLHVHKCRTRRLGFGFQVDLHVQVQPDLTVEEGHDISGAVKIRLLKEGPNVVDVITHLEPYKGEIDSAARE